MVSLVIYMLYQIYLIFNSRLFWPAVDNFLMDNYAFVVFDSKTKWYVLLLIVVYSLLSIFTEILLVWVFTGKKKKKKVGNQPAKRADMMGNRI